MNRIFGSAAIGALVLAAACAATSSMTDDQEQGAAPEGAARMSFFVTSVSPGKGGDYGGLAGADAHCTQLAQAAGSPRSKTWRAYLSAAPMNGQPQVNARDRIGKGPWYNAKGVEIAANIDELHNPDNAKMSKETNLTEKGDVNPGRGDPVNIHDGVTGSDINGRLAPPEVAAGREGAPQLPMPPNMTCNNWTSSDPQLSTMAYRPSGLCPQREILDHRPSFARLQPAGTGLDRRRGSVLLLCDELRAGYPAEQGLRAKHARRRFQGDATCVSQPR